MLTSYLSRVTGKIWNFLPPKKSPKFFVQILPYTSWYLVQMLITSTWSIMSFLANIIRPWRFSNEHWNLEKFPFLKCASGNRALNFLRNFWDISESFLETVPVGTFLVFSRKFPKKCASGYVPPCYNTQIIP